MDPNGHTGAMAAWHDAATAGKSPDSAVTSPNVAAARIGEGGGGTRADGRATAKQVVATAERLFAERGAEAVSLREVAKAAASRNIAVGALAARATPRPRVSRD
jgi:hypothetical protein